MKTYALTLVALLVLTALTFGLSFVHLGPWQAPVAILIAAAKALLVALFFMHLAEQTAPARMAALVGLLMGLMLIVISTLDVATRPEHRLPGTDFPVLTPTLAPPDTLSRRRSPAIQIPDTAATTGTTAGTPTGAHGD